jgi:formamidopyrimidine-DNA glycosylase
VPEGHTLHHLARQLQELVGRRVTATSPQGRFSDGAAQLDGRRLEAVEAFGKHLLGDFGDDHLHVHLGMRGAMFRSDPAGAPRPGVRLRLRADAPPVSWDLVAPTRCEVLSREGRADLLARLGPDPIRGDDPAPAFERLRASRRSVGELLLDQAVVAGVGNVLRAEALHHCGVHPARAGSSLGPDDLSCLWGELTRLMLRAADEGRIITVDTPAGTDRAAIAEEDGRHVYKQPRCRRCGGPVAAWDLGGRTAYACGTCQPPP